MTASLAQLGIPAGSRARNAQKLREVFSTVDASSCPSIYNFHMHTVHSDGQLTPDQVIEQAIHLGLKEFAITDHHTVEGYRRAKQGLEDWRWRHPAPICRGRTRQVVASLPRLWVGVEITSMLLDTDVHILGYGFNPENSAMHGYLQGTSPRGGDQQAVQVIRAIQTAGGLAVLAHPGRYRQSAEDLIREAVRLGIDGIESFYAYDNPKDWRPCPKQTPAIRELVESLGVLSTCGTDTHGKCLTRRI
jgi:predicted metal-dependent phosphoesterase TrpH